MRRVPPTSSSDQSSSVSIWNSRSGFSYFITGLQFLACKCGNVSSERSTMTKNIGMLLLAIYLILAGITTLFHVAIGAVVMGVLALVTGILILVGK